MGLRVQDPVPAAKIIGACGGAGLEKGSLKVRKPKFFFAGAQGHFFDLPEKGVLVGHERNRDAPEGFQDPPGKRRPRGIFIQIDVVDLEGLF